MTFKTYLGVLGAALVAIAQIVPAAADDDNSGSNKKTILVQTAVPSSMSSGSTC